MSMSMSMPMMAKGSRTPRTSDENCPWHSDECLHLPGLGSNTSPSLAYLQSMCLDHRLFGIERACELACLPACLFLLANCLVLSLSMHSSLVSMQHARLRLTALDVGQPLLQLDPRLDSWPRKLSTRVPFAGSMTSGASVSVWAHGRQHAICESIYAPSVCSLSSR